MTSTFFAYLFAFLTLIIFLFQIALAAGMPWGHLAMGGRYPGKFPPNMRVGAVIQACFACFSGDDRSVPCRSSFPGVVKSVEYPDLGSGCDQRGFSCPEPDYAE